MRTEYHPISIIKTANDDTIYNRSNRCFSYRHQYNHHQQQQKHHQQKQQQQQQQYLMMTNKPAVTTSSS
ncbi:unnamed protein product [Gongylonema pulchrum]|uniref:Uncharacterized protein n=1 Tax=Gongylonema pulchrum TaxID=637853 RepID=A0A183EE48_9BILA|nr:unnamed protein product [Gongylonema pulchrum]